MQNLKTNEKDQEIMDKLEIVAAMVKICKQFENMQIRMNNLEIDMKKLKKSRNVQFV